MAFLTKLYLPLPLIRVTNGITCTVFETKSGSVKEMIVWPLKPNVSTLLAIHLQIPLHKLNINITLKM